MKHRTRKRRGSANPNRKPPKALLLFAAVLIPLAGWGLFTNSRARSSKIEPHQYLADRVRLKWIENRFDAELGWTNSHRTRYGERPPATEYGSPWLATFGDSFTYGDEVADGETWQSLLSQAVGADVLNLGVGAYGPDQSLLLYRRKRNALPTKVVALGLSPENLNRVVNVYRKFYGTQTSLPLTKPRFTLQGDKLVIVPNPIQRREDLNKLMEPAFIQKIGPSDYWYTAPAAAAQEKQSPLWKDESSVRLLTSILDTFVAEVKQSGATPVLLLLPSGDDASYWREHHKPSLAVARLLDHCQTKGYTCFNGVEPMGNLTLEQASKPSLYKGPHFSAAGNRFLAGHLLSFFQSKNLTPHPARDVAGKN